MDNYINDWINRPFVILEEKYADGRKVLRLSNKSRYLINKSGFEKISGEDCDFISKIEISEISEYINKFWYDKCDHHFCGCFGESV